MSKKLSSREIHSKAIDIFKEKINEINKERKKYGLVVMAVPGLEKLNAKQGKLVNSTCRHIINDVKEYQKTGVKLSIGTKLEILKTGNQNDR